MITKPTKWTLPIIRSYLELFREDLIQDQGIVFIGELLANRGLYKELWGIWKEKASNNSEIILTIKAIESLLEARSLKGAITGKLNPAVAIFHLKNNYKWTDQQQISVTAQQSHELTEEQVKKIAGRALAHKVYQIVAPSSVDKAIDGSK